MALPSVLDEINRLFDELIRQPWGVSSRRVTPTTVREVADGWVIELPVEGLRASDLQVNVHGHQLTITGHRQQERQHRVGTAWGHSQQAISLHRTVNLPGEVDPDHVDATVKGSTLTVHVRKRKP